MAELHLGIWWSIVDCSRLFMSICSGRERPYECGGGRGLRDAERPGFDCRQHLRPDGFGKRQYPLHRSNYDPDYATQSHTDHMHALVEAMMSSHCRPGKGRRYPGHCGTTGSKRGSLWEAGWSRWTTIICGAITVPRGKPPRSPIPRGIAGYRRSIGAEGCIRRSGVCRSCCTGCGTIRRSARSSSLLLNIAT